MLVDCSEMGDCWRRGVCLRRAPKKRMRRFRMMIGSRVGVTSVQERRFVRLPGPCSGVDQTPQHPRSRFGWTQVSLRKEISANYQLSRFPSGTAASRAYICSIAIVPFTRLLLDHLVCLKHSHVSRHSRPGAPSGSQAKSLHTCAIISHALGDHYVHGRVQIPKAEARRSSPAGDPTSWSQRGRIARYIHTKPTCLLG